MNKPVKEWEYFVTWLLLMVGGIVGGFILGAVAGFIIGFILGAAGVDIERIKVICGVMGFVLGAVWSCVLFRFLVAAMIVRKVEARVRNMTQDAPSDVYRRMS